MIANAIDFIDRRTTVATSLFSARTPDSLSKSVAGFLTESAAATHFLRMNGSSCLPTVVSAVL